jgi:Fe-Mn family superoxide dismutase
MTKYSFIKHVILQESKVPELKLLKLPYARGDLDPAISTETIDYHYGELARAYVDRYNSGEGDKDFNEAGAFLHNLLFPQYQSYSLNNKPCKKSLEFINKHYGNFKDFKDKFADAAMGIQGSGWVYLARNGEIKTIKNHQIKSDIILIVDWWEHAFQFDYKSDKKSYLKNQWNIINWSVIDSRL